MRIQAKITTTSVVLVLATAACVVATILLQGRSLDRSVQTELDVLTRDQLASVAQDVYRIASVQQQSMEAELKHSVSVAREMARLEGGILIDAKARRLTGGADSRRDGVAVGY